MTPRTRLALESDAAAVARIYNDGVEDRVATFETQPSSVEETRAWFAGGGVTVVAEDESGVVVAWASAAPYRQRRHYAGVGDFSVYVARGCRGRGLGRVVLSALLGECEARGFWKIVGRVFPENRASLELCRALGFREVGVYRRHARLDGEWRDAVIVERLLGEALDM